MEEGGRKDGGRKERDTLDQSVISCMHLDLHRKEICTYMYKRDAQFQMTCLGVLHSIFSVRAEDLKRLINE